MNQNNTQKYQFVCTLTFGDIYGQIIVWLITITISLASALALMGAKRPVYALVTVGLVVLLSLPFLLFAFVTTLFNHIEVTAISPGTKTEPIPGNVSQQQPVQATSWLKQILILTPCHQQGIFWLRWCLEIYWYCILVYDIDWYWIKGCGKRAISWQNLILQNTFKYNSCGTGKMPVQIVEVESSTDECKRWFVSWLGTPQAWKKLSK